MKTLILIPSRLAATRLPNKPLLKINNLAIINHVYEKANSAGIGNVYVATGDEEIFKEVKENGGNCILTNKEHHSGTDRIFEAYKKLKLDNIEYIINLQGDEPMINIEDIKNFYKCAKNNKSEITNSSITTATANCHCQLNLVFRSSTFVFPQSKIINQK